MTEKSARSSKLVGMLVIVVATALWGYSNVLIRQTETVMSATVLLWLRFVIAGAVLLPFLPWRVKNLPAWGLGILTGFLLGYSALGQGLGMLTISVDEVAFITALYVVFTPLTVALLQRIHPPLPVSLAAVASLTGAVLLIGQVTLHLRIGVVWSLLSALGFTGQIIGTTALTRRFSARQIAAVQTFGGALGLTVSMLWTHQLSSTTWLSAVAWSRSTWVAVLFLAVGATVATSFMQAWGQSRVSSAEAALGFNLEPVWTALFSFMILAQGMTGRQWVGAIVIIVSLCLASIPWPARVRSREMTL